MPAIILAVLALGVYFFPQQVGYIVFSAIPQLTNTVTERAVEWEPGESLFLAAQVDQRAQLAQAASAFDSGPVLVPLSQEPTLYTQPTTVEPLAAEPTRATESSAFIDVLGALVATVWMIVVPLGTFVSLLLATWALYSYFRLKQIRAAEKTTLHETHFTTHAPTQAPTKMHRRWERIVEQSHSANPNDWRQAILDADIMLDELLEVQGYHGDTMGDKMKQVEKSDFLTIDLAWDAHKVRNRIAHEGSALSLNDREVRRVIELYERVFKEFHLID